MSYFRATAKNLDEKKTYEYFGVHKEKGEKGYVYTFRAYNDQAYKAELTGDFNLWGSTPMKRVGGGVFEARVESDGSIEETCYKYRFYINDSFVLVPDQYARYAQWGKEDASIVYFGSYEWEDEEWIKQRESKKQAISPINIYEVHLGSWRTKEGRSYVGGDRYLNYRDIAAQLVGYVSDMGYTHICIISLAEEKSPFAPTSKHGRPDEFKILVDTMHRAGIGVLLELSEDVGEYWSREFHIDGICFAGERVALGGEEFLMDTSWSKNAIEYAECDVKYKKYKYASLNRALIEGDEKGKILSVSHSDLSDGKGSLFEKMQGDYEEKIARIKLFYSFMMLCPGKKMMFMGSEIGERKEWSEKESLDWFLLECEANLKLKKYVKAINCLYLKHFSMSGSFKWLSPLSPENDVMAFERGDGIVAIFNFDNNEERRIAFNEPHDVILSSDDEIFGGKGRSGLLEGEMVLSPLSAIVMSKKTPFFEKAIDYSRDV